MRILQSLLLTLFVSFNAFGEGVDLNPALLGCIMSGGACFSHTGIELVDQMFGGWETPRHTDESRCRAWLGNWCSGPAGYPSAHDYCREDKKQFWKKSKQKMNDWNPPTGQKPGVTQQWTESDYFDQVEEKFKRDEKGWPKANGPRFFTCNAKQEFIWLKARCSHTDAYKNGLMDFRPGQRFHKGFSDADFAKMKTNSCGILMYN